MNGEGVEFFLTFMVHLPGYYTKSEVGRNTLKIYAKLKKRTLPSRREVLGEDVYLLYFSVAL